MDFEKNMTGKQVSCDEDVSDNNYIPKTISDILKNLSSISDLSDKSSELDLHLRSYENELRKVDAFKRELPLCMQLLKDGIEKLEEEKLECKERERGAEAVMEELFIVAAKSNCDGDGRTKMSIDFSEKKSWMSSSQLWNTPVEYENNLFDTPNEDSFLSLKSSINQREEGSVFKSRGGAFKKPSVPPPVAEAEPIDVRVKESRDLVMARPQQLQRKQRRCWSPELHTLFVDALHNLGGAEVATPKQIREQMKLEGLTNDEVKSHLQKYRIHLRRLASASSSGLAWFTQLAPQMDANIVGSSQDDDDDDDMQENEAVIKSESQSSNGKQ